MKPVKQKKADSNLDELIQKTEQSLKNSVYKQQDLVDILYEYARLQTRDSVDTIIRNRKQELFTRKKIKKIQPLLKKLKEQRERLKT